MHQVVPDPEGPYDLKTHYELEKQLAATLRSASRDERNQLYGSLYDDLFHQVPHHPQLMRRRSSDAVKNAVAAQLAFLATFLDSETVFLEIGAGDCTLSLAVAQIARKVFALDVSAEITRTAAVPSNFALILSDQGAQVPVEPRSIDIAYSDQFIEHLHPEDLAEHLRGVFDALEPSGKYILVTPNRLSGPHDVSRGFDEVATGFHLKEYTHLDLMPLLKAAGFRRVLKHLRLRGRFVRVPLWPVLLIERALDVMPFHLRARLIEGTLLGPVLNVRLTAVK